MSVRTEYGDTTCREAEPSKLSSQPAPARGAHHFHAAITDGSQRSQKLRSVAIVVYLHCRGENSCPGTHCVPSPGRAGGAAMAASFFLPKLPSPTQGRRPFSGNNDQSQTRSSPMPILLKNPFKAWIDHMPGARPRLIVIGDVQVPTSGWHVGRTKRSQQGINPNILMLDVNARKPSGLVLEVVTTVPLRYEES